MRAGRDLPVLTLSKRLALCRQVDGFVVPAGPMVSGRTRVSASTLSEASFAERNMARAARAVHDVLLWLRV